MAAQRRRGRNTAAGRGSDEAVQKRRTARRLNKLLSEGSTRLRLDGRTDKRRKRLIFELKEGKAGEPLLPIDVVSHTHELLELGETVASLKKQGVRPRKSRVTPDLVEVIHETQAAYGFRAEAWQMLGIEPGELEQAGNGGRRRKNKTPARKKKAAAKGKGTGKGRARKTKRSQR